ncbi:MAG TPA: alpha/beta fold hydrolase [Pyrinomonadaceae bacterium]|jgi:triacylglycerol lipase
MPTLPIVLAHGIARFDFLLNNFVQQSARFGFHLDMPTDGVHYFKGIARHLRDQGFTVEHTSVSFAAGVERRAADLKREVERVLRTHNAPQVHIIGHSMGGLDARHMIVNLQMADRVASLTTIGTPHDGSPVARWVLEHEGAELVTLLRRVLDLGGGADLTAEACQQFNAAAEVAEAENNVRYQTWASAEPQGRVLGPLQGGWKIIKDSGAAQNDGLVAFASQQWRGTLRRRDGTTKTVTQRQFPVPADHANEIGWWDIHELQPLDLLNPIKAARAYELSIRNVYLEIARGL